MDQRLKMESWRQVLAFLIIFCLMNSQGVNVLLTKYREMFNAESVRLPTSLRPYMYNITFFFPNLTGGPYENEEFDFTCETKIYITCNEDTDLIRLHNKRHITINSITLASLNDNEHLEESRLEKFDVNIPMETVDIHPGFTLQSGTRYVLTISTENFISEHMGGIYYCPYKEDGITRYMITTVFEPTYARLLFPCFDEPDFKAVFLINIKRQKEITCISNLPRRTTIESTSDNYYTDVFDEPRNVPMSTYLVALTCGDIDYLESSVGDIQLRTYSRRSQVNRTQLTLDISKKSLEFFQDYFEIPYPLPKEDMIAVPYMPFDGMEHWGQITYTEKAMLFEEGVSSEETREYFVVIVSHEISHQWFGNLVSPKWWDDLWLNEGFATYMMFMGADRILPEMKMMNKLIVDYRGIHIAMKADDKLSSHPVYVPVYHASEINMIFDLISYAKGCAVIRMMHFFLGDDTFRNGLVKYLKEFSYKTATHNDLWSTLEKQALGDGITTINVKEIMDTWLLEMNYPVVMAMKVNNDKLHLSQNAFLMDEDERKQRQHVFWEVPFTYTTNNEQSFQKSPNDITWLHKDGNNVTIVDSNLANASWYLGNLQEFGFYRMNYPRENWLALIGQLKTDPFVIHPINRAQIINDVWNLARAGLTDLSLALQCLEYLDKETDYVPWRAAIEELEYVRTSLHLTPIYGLLENFMRKKLQAVYKTTKGRDTSYEIIQHTMIAREACLFGLKECIGDATDIFDRWKADGNIRVDPNIQNTVYCTGVKEGGSAAWDHVLDIYMAKETSAEKTSLLQALTCTDEPWLMAKLINMTVFGDLVSGSLESISMLKLISKNPVGRLMSWNLMGDTWEAFYKTFSFVGDQICDYIDAFSSSYNTPYELKQLMEIIASKPSLEQADWKLNPIVKRLKRNTEWLQKHWTLLETWLTTQ